MHFRHLFSPRLRGSLLLGSLLVASSFSAQAAEDLLRKGVGKGAYEMAFSQQENALWLATSQSRKLDKGGIVYRLNPVTLDVTQVIHNDLKPFGATINNATQTLWFGNTVNSAVTAIDAKTSEVKGRLVLDARKRSEEVRPLQPRELVVDEATNTVYISGLGKESVIWVVDGERIALKETIQNTGKWARAWRSTARRNVCTPPMPMANSLLSILPPTRSSAVKNCWRMAKSTSSST